MNKGSAIFGGAGLGMIIGLLTGLSTSSTVALIVGALTSGLLILLGLQGKDNAMHALRIGAFGISFSIALLAGLYLRVNNAFAPSVSSELHSWMADSIYTMDEAKAYVAYSRLGILPVNAVIDTIQSNKANLTVLYSSDIQISDCELLEGYENMPIANELNAYERRGGIWAKIAGSIREEIPPEDQKKTLHLFRKCLCDE